MDTKETIKIGVREVILGKGQSASDYNSLSNLPIKNLSGPTADDVVNLSSLDTGHYSLTGFYRIDDEVLYTDAPLDIVAKKTDDTLNMYYLSQSERIVYLHTIEYNNGFLVINDRQSLTPDYEALNNLPRVNEETLIGNKTSGDLGLASSEEVQEIRNEVGNVELLLSLI